MDEVFTLTLRHSGSNSHEEFIYSSDNIYDILDKMFENDYEEVCHFQIYVTDYNGKSIPYKDWRNK